jgi:hypothetical protein
MKNFVGMSTTNKFFSSNFSSVNDTAETVSAVSLTPLNNFSGVTDTAEPFSVVSMTPQKWL